MYNNLGVVSCQNGDFAKAGTFFSLALDCVDQQLEYKQFPILTNLLLVGMHLRDGKLLQRAQKCCDEIPSEDLMRYRRSLRPDTLQSGTAESFAFFGFSGISYLF